MHLKVFNFNNNKIVLHFLSLFQVFLLNPKGDLYGLGFDPYKHAPEFRGKHFLRIIVLSIHICVILTFIYPFFYREEKVTSI